MTPLKSPLGTIPNPQKKPIGIAKRRTPIPVDPWSCQMFATFTFLTGTKKVPQQTADPIDDINPNGFNYGFTVKMAI